VAAFLGPQVVSMPQYSRHPHDRPHQCTGAANYGHHNQAPRSRRADKAPPVASLPCLQRTGNADGAARPLTGLTPDPV